MIHNQERGKFIEKFIVVVVVVLLGWRINQIIATEGFLKDPSVKGYQQEEYPPQELFSKLEVLHEKKHPPGPNDWLASHKENGQTFEEFLAGRPHKPDQQRQIIYITLLGEFSDQQKEIVELSADFMEEYFGLDVKFAEPISLSVIPKEARRVHPLTRDKQILTTYVLDQVLKPRLPGDGYCLIAFTSSDLWPGEGWNFVFGQASISERVGVWSIYRNGDPSKSEEEYQLCLMRTMKTGTHEVAHMMSMLHCTAYECAMNGANHRKESDTRPLWLCPVCLRKLIWLTGDDVLDRFRRLAEFCDQHGFFHERDFYIESLKRL